MTNNAASPQFEAPVVLRRAGRIRYFEVIFLTCWLAGWTVGEAFGGFFALAMIARVIARALHLPVPVSRAMESVDGAPSFFLTFAIIWLLFWTFGGVAVAWHLLRTLAGQDRVQLTPDGLRLEQRAGPFRARQFVPRDAVRRIRMRLHDQALVVDAIDGTHVVTTLGTLESRESLRAMLQQRVALPDEAERTRLERETAPPGWDVVVNAPTRDEHIVPPERRRRVVGVALAWVLTTLLALGAVASWRVAQDLERVERESPSNALPFEIGLTLLAGAGAAWLTWGRIEWLARAGRLTRRVSFGPFASEQIFEQGALEMKRKTDDEGGTSYWLQVSTANRRPRTITSASHDAYELVCLGQWLAARTRFPLQDFRG
jgi:hypothetical protein